MFGFMFGVLFAVALVIVFDLFFEWRKRVKRHAAAPRRSLEPALQNGAEAA